MDARVAFLSWLSKKLYLVNVGLYSTIVAVMVAPALLVKAVGISYPIASLLAFFVVLFFRAAYESLVIYEAGLESLSVRKMSILCFVSASIMVLVLNFVRPYVGYFSIPLSLIISMAIVGRLKKALWPSTERSSFFYFLPAKLEAHRFGMYGFFAILVAISYMAYGKYGVDFMYAYTAAYFVGMLFEEIYNLLGVYDQKLSIKAVFGVIVWSFVCAVLSSSVVWLLIGMVGTSGKLATISSVVALKFIQPLGSRKFILFV